MARWNLRFDIKLIAILCISAPEARMGSTHVWREIYFYTQHCFTFGWTICHVFIHKLDYPNTMKWTINQYVPMCMYNKLFNRITTYLSYIEIHSCRIVHMFPCVRAISVWLSLAGGKYRLICSWWILVLVNDSSAENLRILGRTCIICPWQFDAHLYPQ